MDFLRFARESSPKMELCVQDMGVGAGGDGVSVLVAAWERRVAAARAGDILRGLRAKRARAMRLAHHAAQTHDAAWRDQGVYRLIVIHLSSRDTA